MHDYYKQAMCGAKIYLQCKQTCPLACIHMYLPWLNKMKFKTFQSIKDKKIYMASARLQRKNKIIACTQIGVVN